MLENQLLHEINSSREATEEIRKKVLKAKKKGYFSSTEFGRHFLSTFVLQKKIYTGSDVFERFTLINN